MSSDQPSRKDLKEKQALSFAMRLCSNRERCRQEILEKLQDSGLDEDQMIRILSSLESEGFIDEARYAVSFAHDKLRFNKWGKTKIRYQLAFKNIPETIIDQALEGISEKEYLEILRTEIMKKQSSIKAGTAYQVRGKLFNFARQRGFETDAINKVLNGLNI